MSTAGYDHSSMVSAVPIGSVGSEKVEAGRYRNLDGDFNRFLRALRRAVVISSGSFTPIRSPALRGGSTIHNGP